MAINIGPNERMAGRQQGSRSILGGVRTTRNYADILRDKMHAGPESNSTGVQYHPAVRQAAGQALPATNSWEKTPIEGSNLYKVKTSNGINGIGGFGRPRPAAPVAPAAPSAPDNSPWFLNNHQTAGPAVKYGSANRFTRPDPGVPGARPVNQSLADMKMRQFQRQRRMAPAPVQSNYNAPNNNAAKFNAPTPGPLPSPSGLANPGTNAFPNNQPAMRAPTNVWGNRLPQSRDIMRDIFGYRG